MHPDRGHTALRRARVSLAGQVYHITTTTHDRRRWFEDFPTARVAWGELVAWVLMPDHMHVLMRLGEGDTLQRAVIRIKAGTARAVNRHLGRSGALWQSAYHDHVLRSDEDLRTVARYIVANPLRAGLVQRIGEYPHWDAIWLRGESAVFT